MVTADMATVEAAPPSPPPGASVELDVVGVEGVLLVVSMLPHSYWSQLYKNRSSR